MNLLKLYQTPEHSCPYLADRIAVTQFIDPASSPDITLYSQLSAKGFRRSGIHLYRPSCPECNACKSIRLPVKEIVLSKSQRRCVSKAKQFEVIHVKATDTDEHYQLYEKYINGRHKEGDMYPPTRELFRNFLLSYWANTNFMEIRLNSKLIACAVYDQLINSISAVYCYFDPDMKKLSLGKIAIVQQIIFAKEKQLDFLYLGYQIDECKKMNYKNKYHPVEEFIEGQWLRIE